MNFEETSYISNVRKNSKKKFHIFGKEKNTVLMFFQSYLFSWKTDKSDPKLTKTYKNMCFRHIKNFGEKIT